MFILSSSYRKDQAAASIRDELHKMWGQVPQQSKTCVPSCGPVAAQGAPQCWHRSACASAPDGACTKVRACILIQLCQRAGKTGGLSYSSVPCAATSAT